MTEPPDPFACDDELHQLDRDLVEACMARTEARAAYRRSPNAQRATFKSMTERTVDELLELRHEMTSDTQQKARA